jgi:hypothetical protein
MKVLTKDQTYNKIIKYKRNLPQNLVLSRHRNNPKGGIIDKKKEGNVN